MVSVGLAVAVVDAEADALCGPAGPERPARLSEIFPPADRTDASLVAELATVDRLESMLAAYKADLVVELGYRRPAARDVGHSRPHPPGVARVEHLGNPELAGTSEFLAVEIAVVLNCSRLHASTSINESFTLRRELTRAWGALADGVLDRRLRQLARRELLARDPHAADRRRRLTEKAADVALRRGRDGCAELSVHTAAERAAAIHDAVDRYARMRQADGDKRPIGQIRVEVLADLVLRPWDTSRPPLTATLTVLTPLSALTHRSGTCSGATAELGGHPITGAQLRALLEQVEALCPGGLQPPSGGSLHYALTDADGTVRAVIDHADLRRLARRGCPDHPAETCECPLVDRPPQVDRYRPSAAQCRFVTTRDRTCRHPGCGNRAGWADLDHVVPHARGGPTACENLCCLCRRHHRLKTHARGWRFAMSDDGVLTVTTPTGVPRVSRPPDQIDLAIDLAIAQAAARYGSGPPASDPADDPPPF